MAEATPPESRSLDISIKLTDAQARIQEALAKNIFTGVNFEIIDTIGDGNVECKITARNRDEYTKLIAMANEINPKEK